MEITYTTTNSESVAFQNGRDMVPRRNKGMEFFMKYKRIDLSSTTLIGRYGVSDMSVKKVEEILDRFMELYLDYGFKYLPKSQVWIDKKIKLKIMNLRDLQRIIVSSYHYDKTFIQLIEYLEHHGPESWVGLLKWKFASFFAFYEGQDIPKNPIKDTFKYKNKGFFKAENLLGGTFHDFFHKMKSKQVRRYETFKNTVLNGMKKGAPRVSKEFLKKVENDTWDSLTTEQEVVQQVNCSVISLETLELQSKIKNEVLKISKHECYFEGKKRTEADILLEEEKEHLTITKDDIRLQIRRTIREIFKSKILISKLKESILKPRFPSTSANYNYSRNKCGGVGGYLATFRGEVSSLPCAKVGDEDPRIRLPDGRIYLNKGILFDSSDSRIDLGSESCELINHRSSHYGRLGKSEDIRYQKLFEAKIECPELHPIVTIDGSDCIKLYQDNFWRIWRQSLGKDYVHNGKKVFFPEDISLRPHHAKIVVLSEPLKGRPITAEDWDIQNVLSSFQKAVHPILRKMDVFRLIGTPLEESMIQEMFNDLPDKRVINSGDYANATNNMFPWASEACIDDMIDIIEEEWTDEDQQFPTRFTQELKTLLYKSMTRHTFVRKWTEETPVLDEQGNPKYNKKGKPIIKKVVHTESKAQKHGQLMGSVVSFIFLCIINAAVCRYAMELSDRRIYSLRKSKKFQQAKLMINGDDCIFDGWKGRIESIWEKCASIVGLQSSVGKTYFSDVMCTVNSQVFRRHNGIWESSKYINYGLLYGIKKSTTCDDDPKIPVHKIGAFARDLKKQCPEDLWPDIKKRFIYFNFDKLKKCGNIPWFLPEWLGGLGIPNDGELSIRDRQYATIIKRDYKRLQPRPIADAKEWFMHDFVNKKLRGQNVQETPHLNFIHKGKVFDLKEQFDEAYSLLTVSLLFSCHLHDIYTEISVANPDEVVAQQKAFHHNLKMYKLVETILNHEPSVTPMEEDEILPEKRQFLIPVTVLSQPLCGSALRSCP